MAGQEKTPNRTSGAEAIRALPERGEVTPEDLEEIVAEQREMRSKVGDAAKATVETKDGRVSFAEAVKLLEGKLDLEAARTDAVKSHDRWGLVDALIQKGSTKLADAKIKLAKDPENSDLQAFVDKLEVSIIKTHAQYSALFDKATINEADLLKVRESLERGEKVLPIFDPGELTPDDLFAVLFTEGGVPHYTDSYGFKNLANIRSLDPRDIPDLENLAFKSSDEQLAAFKAAYQKAAPMKLTGPRVLFTSDKLIVTRLKISATEDMQAFAKGEMSFLDPNADFFRCRALMDVGLCEIMGSRGDFDDMPVEAYRASLDKAFADKTIDEYISDSGKIARYPTYAYENGGIPRLCFNTARRGVGLRSDFPSYEGLGSRISFG